MNKNLEKKNSSNVKIFSYVRYVRTVILIFRGMDTNNM